MNGIYIIQSAFMILLLYGAFFGMAFGQTGLNTDQHSLVFSNEIGACCIPSGYCQEVTELECDSIGGFYQGDDTNCDSATCFQAPVLVYPDSGRIMDNGCGMCGNGPGDARIIWEFSSDMVSPPNGFTDVSYRFLIWNTDWYIADTNHPVILTNSGPWVSELIWFRAQGYHWCHIPQEYTDGWKCAVQAIYKSYSQDTSVYGPFSPVRHFYVEPPCLDLGACCYYDEYAYSDTCNEMGQLVCSWQESSDFKGVGTECGGSVCDEPDAPDGACCVDEYCYDGITQHECQQLGGAFMGSVTNCASVACSNDPPQACMQVRNMTVCAFSIDYTGSHYLATGNVILGDAEGNDMYFHCGVSSEVEFQSDGIFSSIIIPDPSIIIQGDQYHANEAGNFVIDAGEGKIDFNGIIHTSPSADLSNSLHAEDWSLQFNTDSLHASVTFGDDIFGQVSSAHYGAWELDSCPFFGVYQQIGEPLSFVDGFSIFGSEFTLGLLMKTGEVRLGLKNSALEFSLLGGGLSFNLYDLAPIPTEGTLDIDVVNKGIEIVDDITLSIGVGEKQNSSLEVSSTPTFLANELVEPNLIPISVGVTMKGEEPYDDVNCDGQHNIGESYTDLNGDGSWNNGCQAYLWDSELELPMIDLYGRAELSLSIALLIHFQCGEAEVNMQWHEPETAVLNVSAIQQLSFGDIFEVDHSTANFTLNIAEQKYHGSFELHPFSIENLSALTEVTIHLDTLFFEGLIKENINVFGVDIFTANMHLYTCGPDAFICQPDIDAFGILVGNASVLFNNSYIYGNMHGEFNLGDHPFVDTDNYFRFDNGQLVGFARVKACIGNWCAGPLIGYKIYDGNLYLALGGFYAALAPEADRGSRLSKDLIPESNLHLYDVYGNHIGVDSTGAIECEIAGASFMIDDSTGRQLAYIPSPNLADGYQLRVEGTTPSNFDLFVIMPNELTDSIYSVQYLDQTTETNACHELAIVSENDWQLKHDLDGDSIYETLTYPDIAYQDPGNQNPVTVTNVNHQVQPPSTCVITWQTNVPATSEISYRHQDSSRPTVIVDTSKTINHTAILDSVISGEVYVYNVASMDADGTYGTYMEKTLTMPLFYVCGDANGDGAVNVSDAVHIINYVFKGGSAPEPMESGDANCDETINISDAVYLINYVFKGGPEPCCP